MDTELEFETREAIDARLEGLERVIAAAFDTMLAKNHRSRQKVLARLLMLETTTRQANAHAETVEIVRRFRKLVSEHVC